MTDRHDDRPRPSTGTSSDATPWVNAAAADPVGAGQPRLLLLCDYRPYEAATVIDHIEAIRRWSRSAVHVLPIYGDIPDGLDLEAFDGLVIHYNVVMTSNWQLSPLARWRIRRYTGVKAAFIQDEYRFVDDTVSVMRTLGIDVLFSCVPPGEVDKVYPRTQLPQLRRTVNVLTGYVPDDLLTADAPPYDARPIDVGYRGRRLPPWLGELAREKAVIADRFMADAAAYGLAVDISCDEGDRLYGPAWPEFIARCKAMLGVESGASVFDFDGSIERAVRTHLAAHPGTPFAELQRRFFADAEGRIRLNQISPRSFEAAALGTLMVLYPGEYSGILEPWRHYVPLQRDHSNMAEVVATIRDPARWAEITRRARDEVARNPRYSYRAMAEAVDDGMDLQPRGRAAITPDAFVALAERSFADMPHTKQRSERLPPALGGVRRTVERARRLLTPTAGLVAQSAAYVGETHHTLRSAGRTARAAGYWALRPRTLPWWRLARGGDLLLVDLAELRRLQEVGARALTTTGASPYRMVLDRASAEIRIAVEPDGVDAGRDDRRDDPGGGPPGLPGDLAWVRSVRLDLADRWLAPTDRTERLRIPLRALSRLVREDPGHGRRVLAGDAPWCAVTTAGDAG